MRSFLSPNQCLFYQIIHSDRVGQVRQLAILIEPDAQSFRYQLCLLLPFLLNFGFHVHWPDRYDRYLAIWQAMRGNVTAAIFLLKARHGYRDQGGDGAEPRVQVTITLPGAADPGTYARIIQGEPAGREAARAIAAEAGRERARVLQDEEFLR